MSGFNQSIEVGVLALGLCAAGLLALGAVILTVMFVVRKSPTLDPTYLEQVAMQGAHAFQAGFEAGLRVARSESAAEAQAPAPQLRIAAPTGPPPDEYDDEPITVTGKYEPPQC